MEDVPSAVAEPRKNVTRAMVLVSGWSSNREISLAAGAGAGVGFESESTASAHRVGWGVATPEAEARKERQVVRRELLGIRLTVCLRRLGLAGLGCEHRVV